MNEFDRDQLWEEKKKENEDEVIGENKDRRYAMIKMTEWID